LQALALKDMRTTGVTSKKKKKGQSRRARLLNVANSIKFGMPLSAPPLERPDTTHVKFFGNGNQTELF
jgi:hypothetical protein